MSSILISDRVEPINPIGELYGGTGKNTYSTGDILYSNSTNSLEKLAIGSANKVLTSNGTIPVWLDSQGAMSLETLNLNSSSQAISPSINYTFLNGTSPIANWRAKFSSGGFDNGRSVSTNSTGVYITGEYNGVLTFFDSNDVVQPNTLTSVGSDAFVAKYNHNGDFLWRANISSASNGIGRSIATDNTNVYVLGQYTNTVTFYNFDDTSSISTLTSANDVSYIVKYNNNGTALWRATITSFDFNVSGNGITVDNTGIYITGSYNGTVSFLSSNDTSPLSVLTNASVDGYVAKYSDTGIAQWRARITSVNTDIGYSITTNSTGIFITGSYSGTVNFYNSDDISTLATLSSSFTDGFVVKYSNSGTALWRARITSINTDIGFGITSDSTGIYIVGYYSDTVTFYNSDDSISLNTLSNSLGDAFVVKYSNSGNAIWRSRISSSNSDTGYSIITDSTGVYVTGYYNANVNFYNSDDSITIGTLINSGTDAFVVKYDNNGTVIWRATITSVGTEIGYGITAGSGGIYITGYTDNGNTSFYNPDDTITIPTLGGVSSDGFIVRYDTLNLASLANGIITSTKVISNLNMNNGVSEITVSNLKYQGSNKTKIVLTFDGDTIELGWNGSYWFVINNNGAILS